MLQIIPDENERAGGYGFVVIASEGFDPASPVTVEILETYGNRWLGQSADDGATASIGDPHWQSLPHRFGPYEVRIQDRIARVRIGPEIVNKVPEYTHCRVKVGPVTSELIWPDTLTPRAGATALGGIRTISRPHPVEPASFAMPEPLPLEPVAGAEVEPTALVAAKRRGGVYLALSVFMVLLPLAAGWIILSGIDEVPSPEVVTPKPEAAPVSTDPVAQAPEQEPAPQVTADPAPPASEACSLEALTEGTANFAGVYDRLSGCAGQISPDQVFDMLETARTANDSAALRLFGSLYDPTVDEPVLETAFGLGAPANLALAVEYYSKAKANGDTDAIGALTAACTTLAEDSSTIAKGAHYDFCR
jgi:hypothetical protein